MATVKAKCLFRRLKYKTTTRRDSTGSSLDSCSSSMDSSSSSSTPLSPYTPCQSTESLHLPEILAKTVIKRNVNKLRLLADRIERVNSSLGLVLAESHELLASQQHLDHPIVKFSYEASMDVQWQYLDTLEELVLAEELLCSDLLRRGEQLADEVGSAFLAKSVAGQEGDSEDSPDRRAIVSCITSSASLATILRQWSVECAIAWSRRESC